MAQIRHTAARLEYGHGWAVLVSYETPVAAIAANDVLYVTDTRYSATTSRHINEFVRNTPHNEVVKKDESFFRDLLKQIRK